ncbi:translin-associated protein X isoform X2 [Lingula anatina]|uniref:Translin-associated protein X isoform X2 n=1 Tax=Lingula anatina TaxID=7574 RepID=A0A1S3KC30_LINAN|nr:translin-associated protein X isoform X2 [Lingula anatina]|eukprot:XP_013420190.1 translin-associated protein X isoform X2 [Lingula anatina]
MAHRGSRRGRRTEHKHANSGEKRDEENVPKLDENSNVFKAFKQYQSELDGRHDKYERLVKLSRDVTIDSKRTIFLLHRSTGSESKAHIMEEAEDKLRQIQLTKFKPIAAELQNEDVHQFLRAISPGLQEYIEAVSFFHYLRDGTLVSLEQVQKDLVFDLNANLTNPVSEMESTRSGSPSAENTSTENTVKLAEVYVSPMDYVLGIADLTGELMRMAINSVGTGDLELPFTLCSFMRVIHDAFLSFGNVARELPRKLAVLKQSLQKVESACYTVQVRGSEIPQHMLVDVISFTKNIHNDFDDATELCPEN